ncbi:MULTISPECIES: DUF2510 domain-containing protein [Streptomyces]|uniref:DUF2510 domain-containing protein n=1 Tax=Streptomyces doudnae TaxID=3075536 RepID=A0ABD5EES0_9ACTN|nr:MULTISPECIES: DUF2510 domain-containing protein [unclassified Streptomyces]MDT0433106.1 DUF2510 domain-containing protein [Streptomyces sp. DSM 41981]MYQ66342.1 DUF2510 domain-containing protein [Streptomyces sp. SID4950]SCE18669.1 Protein of unknown function [Streptomyces sp. SolWspMP-5a-2]
MTQETPPGWYPDPGQTDDGPAAERWWDGRAWTERTRPAGSAAAWGPPAQAQGKGEDPAVPSPADGPPPGDRPATGQGTAADPAGGAPAAGHGAYGNPADGYPAGPQQPPGQGAYGYPAAGQGAYGNPAPGPGAYGAPAGAQGAYGYPSGHPGYPAYPAQPPAAPRRGLRTGIAVGAAVVVLACIGVGVYALTDGNGSGGDTSSSRPGSGGQGGRPGGPEGGQGGPFGGDGGAGGGSGSGGGDGESPVPGQSEAPKIESGSVTDAVSGISIPIPDGWYGQQLSVGAQVSSNDTYKCPGDTSKSCTKGGAYSAPAQALGTDGSTAEEVAKADIAGNAEDSYGGKTYGAITSHDVLASKAVTVAGQKGYLVRWKAVTSKGDDGFVQSLAFPAPSNPRLIVVVRFGVDASEKQSVIDEITKGIKVSSGGGDGKTV